MEDIENYEFNIGIPRSIEIKVIWLVEFQFSIRNLQSSMPNLIRALRLSRPFLFYVFKKYFTIIETLVMKNIIFY